MSKLTSTTSNVNLLGGLVIICSLIFFEIIAIPLGKFAAIGLFFLGVIFLRMRAEDDERPQ